MHQRATLEVAGPPGHEERSSPAALSDQATHTGVPRRALLKAGAASVVLNMPWLAPRAQGHAKPPRIALVIGNAAYRRAPALRNPGHDAQAMATALEALGFEVVLTRDADRGAMQRAIEAHLERLKQRQGVGLFYFAGHGLQLAWRNYLVPVDATITSMEEMPARCVDLGTLADGLAQAGNPMNVVILDACRQNPFSADFKQVQPGLSQMDAPPTTLLAYATAPGHLASDGAGANGLYTTHLLREMQVPGAKIEDVFKRVRLDVRRASRGEQVPWESTSLEGDFFFVPAPAAAYPASQVSDAESAFDRELVRWDDVKQRGDAEALTAFLRDYPSGHFSELAQLRLDQLLTKQGETKVAVVSAEANPYSKGTAVLDARYRVGDSYSYRVVDPETGEERRRFTSVITEVNDREIVFDRGLVTDLQGNTLRMHDGRRFTDNQNVPDAFEVGRQWVTRYRVGMPNGRQLDATMRYTVVSREPIDVPAGRFNAFLVEGRGRTITPRGPIDVHLKLWWDPQRIRRPVVREEHRQPLFGLDNGTAPGRGGGMPGIALHERLELTRFSQAES